ncbi:uncharacterized protein LOC124550737 [Schistocerca americana]|uniref:uncharacterized protein LOC124550737 n=1 Tax=Schistocerca americana TaxID=7009 RepID=UPI001F500C3B|nr:uncharacterized protein LOC124550737 [Schistocerca americana]
MTVPAVIYQNGWRSLCDFYTLCQNLNSSATKPTQICVCQLKWSHLCVRTRQSILQSRLEVVRPGCTAEGLVEVSARETQKYFLNREVPIFASALSETGPHPVDLYPTSTLNPWAPVFHG